MHWSALWWIFPLACMVMMVVMGLFMAGLGGMRCMPWMRRMDERGWPDEARKPRNGPSSSGGSPRPYSGS